MDHAWATPGSRLGHPTVEWKKCLVATRLKKGRVAGRIAVIGETTLTCRQGKFEPEEMKESGPWRRSLLRLYIKIIHDLPSVYHLK
jgi:hypothetical protein